MAIASRHLLFSLALASGLARAAAAQEEPELIASPELEPAPVAELVAAPAESILVPDPALGEPQAAPPSEGIVLEQSSPTTATIDASTGIVTITDHPDGFRHERRKTVSVTKKKVPPTTGWSQPGTIAIRRTWVPYYKMFPNAWTGEPIGPPPVRAPMVYMPTDTTQLGYYYQHVPHWHAYPNMIPGVPNPHDYHVLYRTGTVRTGVNSGMPTRTDVEYGQPTTIPEPTPDAQPTPIKPREAGELDRSAINIEDAPVRR